jgi:hypothetical protein
MSKCNLLENTEICCYETKKSELHRQLQQAVKYGGRSKKQVYSACIFGSLYSALVRIVQIQLYNFNCNISLVFHVVATGNEELIIL